MIGTSALALLSAACAVLWFAAIALLHGLKPQLDPKTRMVSEYACGRHGWIMQLAFFCMAASCWALAAATWSVQPLLGPALLIVCGAGLVGAGVFITDPVLPSQKTQTRSGALHILFAFAVMVLLPIMASVVSWNLDTKFAGAAMRCGLLALAALTWAGLAGFAGATFRSIKRPGAPIGAFERLLLVVDTAWLILAALAAAGLAGQPPG